MLDHHCHPYIPSTTVLGDQWTTTPLAANRHISHGPRCAGRVSANTRLHQLRWGDREWAYYMSCARNTDDCPLMMYTYTCSVHVCIRTLYIGRESGSDNRRGATEGGRNGVRQGKNEDNARDSCAMHKHKCSVCRSMFIPYTTCTCVYLQSLSLHHSIGQRIAKPVFGHNCIRLRDFCGGCGPQRLKQWVD